MKLMIIILILQIAFLSCSCKNREDEVDKSKLVGKDYRLFQKTTAWELAKAVQDEDEEKIKQILSKNQDLINYQEPIFGSTLLMLTVRNQQFKPFNILLNHGADVNIHNSFDGSTALIESCEFSFYDIKFTKTLLDFGANVNDVQTDIGNQGLYKTALMKAAGTGNLDLVKLLIENGAELNFQNKFGQSALNESILLEKYNIALFFLQNGADYRHPIFYRPDYSNPSDYQVPNDKGKPIFLENVLREDFFELDSDKYKYKMQIVDFLKSKAIDYRSTPIPDYIKEKAKEKYPNTWQDYLEKY